MKNYPLVKLSDFPLAITDRHSKKELKDIINLRNTTDSYLALKPSGRLAVILRTKNKNSKKTLEEIKTLRKFTNLHLSCFGKIVITTKK